MKIIKHRVNRSLELLKIPREFGVEIDLRWDHKLGIYLAHDPNSPGELFHDWLEGYQHGTLILNVKEDGLEEEILALMKSFSISDFFFLDQPQPTLIKSLLSEVPTAIRISEYETIPTNLPKTPQWFWVDSFTGSWEHLIPSLNVAAKMKIKTCVVSPELQGRESSDEVREIKAIIAELWETNQVYVCTKWPESWIKYE